MLGYSLARFSILRRFLNAAISLVLLLPSDRLPLLPVSFILCTIARHVNCILNVLSLVPPLFVHLHLYHLTFYLIPNRLLLISPSCRAHLSAVHQSYRRTSVTCDAYKLQHDGIASNYSIFESSIPISQ